jgi:hypothetical protein
MDNERDILHKILDGDAGEDEKTIISRSMETDPGLREEFTGLMHTVRMLEKSERREAPVFFTAEVMKKLPKRSPSVLSRLREFMFNSRVLRWNMASALAMAAILVISLVSVSRLHRAPDMTVASAPGEAATVRLTYYSPQARRVAVAGDFNKWKTDAHEMKGADGMWSIDLKLKPGVYSYSFVVDGKSWVPDPGAEAYEDDGFGSRNAVMRVNI